LEKEIVDPKKKKCMYMCVRKKGGENIKAKMERKWEGERERKRRK